MMRRVVALVLVVLFIIVPQNDDEDEPWYGTSPYGEGLIIVGEGYETQPGFPVSEDGPGQVFGEPGNSIIYHGCDLEIHDVEECAWLPTTPVDLDPYDDYRDGDDPVVITMRDVAQFQPAASELIIEPNGWGIVHRPVNVFTDADVHTTTGTVLGQPVTIDWIPVSFTVDYGDGTRLTYTNPGESWSEGEVWATTETSHVYSETGDYIVSASVEYMAIVHVGGSPVPVDGTIDVDSGSEAISIYWVKTRIVRGDCIEYPLDPGCEIP